jgi:hypothetical protein
MRRLMIVMLTAGVALGGCNGSGPGSSAGGEGASTAPVKRMPGSWSSKIELVRLEGPDVPPGAKEQMQPMFDMMSAISVCMTPEAIAKEDPSKNLEQSAGSKDCTFDKRNISGSTLEFSGTCERDGKKVRMTAKGTLGATSQDINMVIEPLNASGTAEGVMEMRVTSKHNGECKPTDIRPPVEGEKPKS